MVENIICPHCNIPNQAGDKYCMDCGQPLGEVQTSVSSGESVGRTVGSLAEIGQDLKMTEPLLKESGFLPRPENAIFGDRFLCTRLIHSDGQQHGYLVTEVAEDETNRIKQCTNPECGAVHGLLNGASESFCSRCNAPLSSESLTLMLFEAKEQIFGNAPMVAGLNLAHEGLRTPVAAFDEKVTGETRYCLVTPYSEMIHGQVDKEQVCQWGVTLAAALDYLHDNNLTYNGHFYEDVLSLSNNHVVIASFYDCIAAEKLQDRAKVADLNALAKVLYKWLTGANEFDHDIELSPALVKFFDKALNPPGFLTGKAFSLAFSDACFQVVDSGPVDHLYGRLTDVGIARTLNEDCLLTFQVTRYLESVPRTLGVYIVADGMGGHSAGEVASGMIVNTIAEVSLPGLLPFSEKNGAESWCRWIDDTIQNANVAVYEHGRKLGSDMGSTLVMAVVDGNNVCIGHVGDSRAYKINDKGITPLTADHSLVQRLIDTGQITRDEARTHPQRNVIYRTIGDKREVEVDTSRHTFNSGDRLLLCSDGLNGMVEDDVIWQIVMDKNLSLQSVCEKLIQAANAAGGEDNITVVIVEID